MNESGRSVAAAAKFFKVEPDAILVVHDEGDFDLGRLQARLGGGLAGHNGLKSLKAGFGSPDFNRVRVGVGRPDSMDPEIVSRHVLGTWKQSSDEVRDLVAQAADAAERLVTG